MKLNEIVTSLKKPADYVKWSFETCDDLGLEPEWEEKLRDVGYSTTQFTCDYTSEKFEELKNLMIKKFGKMNEKYNTGGGNWKIPGKDVVLVLQKVAGRGGKGTDISIWTTAS